jgi:hypothetical protein
VGENSERLAGHLDSWIAPAIMLVSLLVALLLNRERLGVRQAGVLLAGLGCLGVAVWFGMVLATGGLANPKPAVIPLDHAKPVLLWLQAAAAEPATAAARQSRDSIAQATSRYARS